MWTGLELAGEVEAIGSAVSNFAPGDRVSEINYKEENFAERSRALTDDIGVDLVQDFIGARYWQQNLQCLQVEGRLVLIGLMGGTKVEADLNVIIRKRLHVIGSVMRSQPPANKMAICRTSAAPQTNHAQHR